MVQTWNDTTLPWQTWDGTNHPWKDPAMPWNDTNLPWKSSNVLAGATVDMDFANSIYYGGTLASLLSTTRAQTVSSYATTAAGVLVPFAANTPRITDLGLLVEEARTKVVLWNRDLTNAVWTKTNITPALDQTGADGTANSASSLTATAGNGTALQAITLASSARFQTVYMKRITGTGNVDMTMDNGSTWTTVSGSINSSTYTRVSIPTQTLANPTVGFRLVTSGDKVAVDFVDNENGTFATSPLQLTTVAVARNADTVQAAGALLSNALTAKSAFFQTYGVAGGTSPRMLQYGGGANMLFTGTTGIELGNNTNVADATLGSGTYASAVKSAFGFDTSMSAVGNNGTVATSANAWAANTGAVYLGNRSALDRALNGYISRLTVWNSRLPDATLKSLTTP